MSVYCRNRGHKVPAGHKEFSTLAHITKLDTDRRRVRGYGAWSILWKTPRNSWVAQTKADKRGATVKLPGWVDRPAWIAGCGRYGGV